MIRLRVRVGHETSLFVLLDRLAQPVRLLCFVDPVKRRRNQSFGGPAAGRGASATGLGSPAGANKV